MKVIPTEFIYFVFFVFYFLRRVSNHTLVLEKFIISRQLSFCGRTNKHTRSFYRCLRCVVVLIPPSILRNISFVDGLTYIACSSSKPFVDINANPRRRRRKVAFISFDSFKITQSRIIYVITIIYVSAENLQKSH